MEASVSAGVAADATDRILSLRSSTTCRRPTWRRSATMARVATSQTMYPNLRSALAIALVLMASAALGKTSRSHEAKAAFQRAHPCPSTGHTSGSCPGYTIDHRIALCVGGKDEPANMRWQENRASFAKDKWECKPGWEKRLAECEEHGCFVP